MAIQRNLFVWRLQGVCAAKSVNNGGFCSSFPLRWSEAGLKGGGVHPSFFFYSSELLVVVCVLCYATKIRDVRDKHRLWTLMTCISNAPRGQRGRIVSTWPLRPPSFPAVSSLKCKYLYTYLYLHIYTFYCDALVECNYTNYKHSWSFFKYQRFLKAILDFKG